MEENRIAARGRVHRAKDDAAQIYLPVEIVRNMPFENKEKVKIELFKKEKKIVVSKWDL
ncbi:MAG: hypothetical protein NT130_03545 [Candidatus Micrarchaeota archaeon]|nr:hypothetical protein [Candidatus Micrarchaeota archaeon]